MDHKVLVDGTAYEIKGGRTLIGGTGYDIAKGRTLIGGTAYDISFQTLPPPTFPELMATAVYYNRTGQNASSTNWVFFPVKTLNVFPLYVFVFVDGEFSFNKWDGTNLTVLYQSSASEANCRHYGNALWYSKTGSANDECYGGTIFSCHFNSYTEAQVDACLSGVTPKASAGRNASTRGQISLIGVDADDTIIAAYTWGSTKGIGVSSPLGTVVYSYGLDNPSGLYVSGSTAFISDDGTLPANLYGGTIIRL